MRNVPGFLVVTLLAGCSAAFQPAPAPEGRWLTATGNVEVTIQSCGAALCGDVTQVFGNNSMQGGGVSKAPPPQVGLRVISDLRPDGDAWKGRIFNRENGKTYDCRISLAGPDALTLRVYIVLPLFGKTLTWRRTPT